MRLGALARVGALAVVLTIATYLAPMAMAAAPSCATGPTGPTGVTGDTAAVVQLDQDENQNCAAVVSRLDSIDSDVTSGASQAHGDSGKLDSDLQAIQEGQTGQTGQTVALDQSTLGTLNGDAHGLHVDLWMMIGALVAVFAFGEFLRRVWP